MEWLANVHSEKVERQGPIWIGGYLRGEAMRN